jgi:hypothetical protein
MRRLLRAGLSRALPSDASALTPLAPLVDPRCASVVTCPRGELTRAALEELFAHRCCAVRVPGFYPVASARIMRERLLNSDQRRNWNVADPQRGLESSDVESVGTPLTMALAGLAGLAGPAGPAGPAGEHGNDNGDALGSSSRGPGNSSGNGNERGGREARRRTAMQQYLRDAKDLTYYLRTGISRRRGDASVGGSSENDATHAPRTAAANAPAAAPLMMTPMDKLCLELDACWPGGAGANRDEASGEKLLAGAGRIMHPRGSDDPGFCHVDDIAVMKELSGTFSANVYLQTPPPGCGGELQIWPLRVASRWDFYRHAASLSLLLTQEQWAQDALRRLLPPPVSLAPEDGELILICAQRPHAVAGFDAGLRVSMQAFVNADGAGKRLTLDS